ncbi:hypothetical protein HY480_04205, partial [Candidatus Uhrbacteria bacterium]|nr:hypothetical protein [Candidatus Uhrbacteria bacterium]
TGTITWTPKEVPDLAALAPGEQRLIAFTLPLRAADAIAYPPGAIVTFTASATITATGTAEKPRQITTVPITITIGS